MAGRGRKKKTANPKQRERESRATDYLIAQGQQHPVRGNLRRETPAETRAVNRITSGADIVRKKAADTIRAIRNKGKVWSDESGQGLDGNIKIGPADKLVMKHVDRGRFEAMEAQGAVLFDKPTPKPMDFKKGRDEETGRTMEFKKGRDEKKVQELRKEQVRQRMSEGFRRPGAAGTGITASSKIQEFDKPGPGLERIGGGKFARTADIDEQTQKQSERRAGGGGGGAPRGGGRSGAAGRQARHPKGTTKGGQFAPKK
jgi:hypothetical protein